MVYMQTCLSTSIIQRVGQVQPCLPSMSPMQSTVCLPRTFGPEVQCFAAQVVPRIIAENSGLNATDVVSSLHAAHANGQQTAGLDIETGQPKDLAEDGILDLFSAKWWALKLATDAVVTVLRVDQIIMAKQAGGPKPRQGGGDDED